MKKILIFYASYGGGHLNAAKSIKDCIDNNYRVEYYCVPHTMGQKLFRKRTSIVRYRKDGTTFFIANKHRVSFDDVFLIDSKVWR